jgi:hypothetical protein
LVPIAKMGDRCLRSLLVIRILATQVRPHMTSWRIVRPRRRREKACSRRPGEADASTGNDRGLLSVYRARVRNSQPVAGMRECHEKSSADGWGPIPALVLVLLLTLAPGVAQAVIAPELEAEGWRELPNPNKKENVFSLTPEGAIEVVSSDSVSTLHMPVEVDIDERPMLTWRWRVDEPAPATDLSVKGQDDCALAVYVGFPFHPEQASFFERLKRPLVESWVGDDAPGRVLRYVFCGSHERGEVVESPYLGSAGVIEVLRPADSPTGVWFEERVDLAADYREAFGEEPPNPTQLAIQADTDNTHSQSRADIADLAFVPRAAAAAAAQNGAGPGAPPRASRPEPESN